MPQPGKCVNDNLLRRNIAVKAYGKGYLWTTLRKPWFVCELGHDEVGLKKALPKLWKISVQIFQCTSRGITR